MKLSRSDVLQTSPSEDSDRKESKEGNELLTRKGIRVYSVQDEKSCGRAKQINGFDQTQASGANEHGVGCMCMKAMLPRAVIQGCHKRIFPGRMHAYNTRSSDQNFMRGRNALMQVGDQREGRNKKLVTYLSRRPSVAPTLNRLLTR